MTRTKSMVTLVFIGAIAMAGACGLETLRRNGYFLSDHGRLSLYSERICDGRGKERPCRSRRDYFALFIEFLRHPNTSVREAAASTASTTVLISGTHFGYLADGYIVGGRDGELKGAVLDAWREARPNTWERLELANAYLDLRRRQYIWANPEFAKSIGLEKETPRSKEDLWWGFSRTHQEAIDARLGEGGDKEFDEVRQNYLDLMEAHLKHTLSEDE